MTRKLLLIRHSISQRVPGEPANTWGLTEEGRALCQPLGVKLAQFALSKIYTSEEPKALQTAQLAAGHVGVPFEGFPGLQEHARVNTPYFPTPDEFMAAVQRFFEQPARLVLGEETANQSLVRFDAAVKKIVANQTTGDIAITSHGTVIALFVAKYNEVPVRIFWQSLKMPDIVVLQLPAFRLS